MQEQLNSVLQQQLRDLHLPEAVSWWPIAIGWWILLGLISLAAYLIIRNLVDRKKRNQYRKAALEELNLAYRNWQSESNTSTYLQTANAILKRAVLINQNDLGANKLTGQSWADTLSMYSPSALSALTRDALAFECYQPQPNSQVEEIHPELCAWIEKHQTLTKADNGNSLLSTTPNEASNA